MKSETDLRYRMVEDQIVRRGVRNAGVVEAMRNVERHRFVPEKDRSSAYEDCPLPIGHGQTISQPYIVAYMTERLELFGDEQVLEIGTGSGYQTAILAEVSKRVYTVEIVEPLYKKAKSLLQSLGYTNITCLSGDGYSGCRDFAPFDRIILTAAAPVVPEPLEIQLKVGGILLMPLGHPYGYQELVIYRKHEDGFRHSVLTGVRFVPMTGRISKRPDR